MARGNKARTSSLTAAETGVAGQPLTKEQEALKAAEREFNARKQYVEQARNALAKSFEELKKVYAVPPTLQSDLNRSIDALDAAAKKGDVEEAKTRAEIIAYRINGERKNHDDETVRSSLYNVLLDASSLEKQVARASELKADLAKAQASAEKAASKPPKEVVSKEEKRIRAFEKQGMTRSDAQSAVEAEDQTVASIKSKGADMTLSELARIASRNWKQSSPKGIYFGAKPYLSAMGALDSTRDNFGADSGREIVAYFLSNATTWRGPIAAAVKAELNKRLK